jgi:hypothetical protein
MTRQPIFLFSLPRSGSTWAANAVAAAINGRLVHEPFNWRTFPRRSVYHMRYIPAGAHEPDLVRIVLRNLKGLPLLGRYDRRPIVKDVHVLLALDYLAEWFNPFVILLVRHPCSVAQSWQRLGLEIHFRLDLLLQQDMLYDRWLAPFAQHMKASDDYFFSIGAFWGATHYILAQLALDHPEWQWLTHEALCLDEGLFVDVLRRLGVPDQEIDRQRLANFLQGHNRRRTTGEDDYSLARLSYQEPDKWKRVMSAEQISAVTAGVAPFEMLESWAQWTTP